jgi:hypothetical protein
MDLTGLDTLLLSDSSKITELEIRKFPGGGRHVMGLTHVLQAFGHPPRSPSWVYAAFLLVATKPDYSGWHCVTFQAYSVLIWQALI